MFELKYAEMTINEPGGEAQRDLQAGSIPKQAQGVISRAIEDEVVLYDPRADGCHVLNATAAAVWWLVDGERTVDEITGAVADLYAMSVQAVRKDVEGTLGDFIRARLIGWR